jgi:hypothetical protein
MLDATAVFVTNATNGLFAIERIDGFTGGQSADFDAESEALSPFRTALSQMQELGAQKLI